MSGEDAEFFGDEVDALRTRIAADDADDKNADKAVGDHRVGLWYDSENEKPHNDNRTDNPHEEAPPDRTLHGVLCDSSTNGTANQAKDNHQPNRDDDGDALPFIARGPHFESGCAWPGRLEEDGGNAAV